MWKERHTKKLETAKQKPVVYIVSADVKAVYPSMYRETVTKALECPLEKHSDYSADARKIIVELINGKWEFSPPANDIQVNPVWRSY